MNIIIALAIMALIALIMCAYAYYRKPVQGDETAEVTEQTENPSEPVSEEEPTTEPQEEEKPSDEPQSEPEPTEEEYICHSATHRLPDGQMVSGLPTDELVQVGTYDIDQHCNCQWDIIGVAHVEGNSDISSLEDFEFKDGKIMAKIWLSNFDSKPRTTRFNVVHKGECGEHTDFFDVTQDVAFDVFGETKKALEAFKGIVDIPDDSKTYWIIMSVLIKCFYETHHRGVFYKKENFPTLYYYGNRSDRKLAWKALSGWVAALILAQLCPKKRNKIFAAGYNYGGGKDVALFGWEFESDPIIARLVGAAVWSCKQPSKNVLDEMRKEVGGSVLDYTVKEIADGSFTDLQDKVFIDFTKFLPTAPGPYLSAYKDRSKVGGIPFPNDAKESDYNLSVDKEVYEHVVCNYNLDDNRNYQDTVQAIADKDGSAYHLFDGNRRTEHYTFHPVFGESTIGRYISVETDMAKRCTDAFTIGVMARKPLMLGDYYGRRRPGQTEIDGQSKDGDFGVLYNLEIDNADGNPTSYNQDGELSYAADQKNSVYANSYPSGHSSGIMACANIMMEWMPDEADKILRAANEFANSRIKCRYHNLSDTLIGRLVGTAITSVIRACKDY